MESDVKKNSDESIQIFDSQMMFNKLNNFKIYEMDRNLSGITEHSHNYMQIWYVCKGECDHWIKNSCYRMVKGDMFVLPPYIVHKTKPVEGEDVKVIGFEFSANFFDSKFDNFTLDRNLFNFAYIEPFLVSEDMVKPKLNLSAEAQTEVERLIYEMLKEYNEEKEYYDMLIRADVLKLLTIIAREYARSNKSKESEELFDKYKNAIENAITYIHENYNEEIHLDDICRFSMMSKTYFCYIFKSITGKTFAEYLIDIRIKKAIELLQNTDMPITKICFEVGFNDITHFCRTFKKVVGVSAKYYRKATIIE